MTFYYFAYGSNMLPARLKARCKSARVVGPAIAVGFELEFSKKSHDRSGKATLIEASTVSTPGVLFEIDKSDLSELDEAESGYLRKEDFMVDLINTGEHRAATTYLAEENVPQLLPYDWYLALIIAGAKFHEFGGDYLEKLRGSGYRIDDNDSRRARQHALVALQEHGNDDYRALLTKIE